MGEALDDILKGLDDYMEGLESNISFLQEGDAENNRKRLFEFFENLQSIEVDVALSKRSNKVEETSEVNFQILLPSGRFKNIDGTTESSTDWQILAPSRGQRIKIRSTY